MAGRQARKITIYEQGPKRENLPTNAIIQPVNPHLKHSEVSTQLIYGDFFFFFLRENGAVIAAEECSRVSSASSFGSVHSSGPVSESLPRLTWPWGCCDPQVFLPQINLSPLLVLFPFI